MRGIITTAFAVALAAVWATGVAADEAKLKAENAEDRIDVKTEDTRDTGESRTEGAQEKAIEAKDRIKEKAVEAREKIKEKATQAKERLTAPPRRDDRADRADRMSDVDVRAAQEALRHKGFDPGPTDGVMGPRTMAALSDFQRANGLPVTGKLDARTASELVGETGRTSTVEPPPAAAPATEAPRPQRP